MNHYELLNIPRDATAEEVKKAFKRMAKVHHPDKGATDGGAAFKELKAAFDTLFDPASRARYDREHPPIERTESAPKREGGGFTPLQPRSEGFKPSTPKGEGFTPMGEHVRRGKR